MSESVLIDTDVLIEYLRGRNAAQQYLESIEKKPSVSVITVAELYSGTRDDSEIEIIDSFMLAFDVIPLDPEIAKIGGQLRNKYKKSHNIGLADALIAATAIVFESRLITFNIKHYPMLENASVPYQRA